MVTHALDWLDAVAQEREAAGLRRVLTPRSAHGELLDLASNDYLGLATDPRVVSAGVEALRTWGAGATGSRLVTGTTELHAELEAALASFAGTESALVFSSGYAANLAVVTALCPAGSLVVSDSANHASLIDACRLARGRVQVVPHNDLAAFETALAQRTERRAVVVTESVDSIDGDGAPLARLHEICRRQGAVLVVDEAHGFGIVGPGGRGALAEAGLAGQDDVIVTVTLSKALGSQGGAVLGPRRVIGHLIGSARTMIFDTGLAPAAAGAALAALRVLEQEPALGRAAIRVAGALAAAAGVRAPHSAIVPVLIGDPGEAVAAARRCAVLGLRVGCFRPPSVPEGTSRLRLTARANLSRNHLLHACDVLRVVLGRTDNHAIDSRDEDSWRLSVRTP
ncbi:8-amino-7-oxononanoate synthase [Amycolatopsis australiensis]|uniref:8-amino-7-oxononanoate synthase n=1 Tax=Amycolatopsis australiensis TaxID=546364 RepID=A0A1K1RM49_9PSEU|nr:8-amino-7-oxononanoate synthase [Amycolatopsis australiensis]SFW73224.1 8-amino-7-oxononanoate synthase [Amycolatopsis australiensis]